MRNSFVFILIFSFRSSRDWERCWKTLSFKYPKKNNHTGLDLVAVVTTQRLALKRSDAQQTFSSIVLLCELWHFLVETTYVLHPHCPTWVAKRSATFHFIQHWRSEWLLHNFDTKVRVSHTKVRNCTPNSYGRRGERSFVKVKDYVEPVYLLLIQKWSSSVIKTASGGTFSSISAHSFGELHDLSHNSRTISIF